MVSRGQLHAPSALSRGNNPCTHWTEGWVGPRAGVDIVVDEKKSLPLPEVEPGGPTSGLSHSVNSLSPAPRSCNVSFVPQG
jgi:hypothetical protein